LHDAPDKGSQDYQHYNGKDDPEKIAGYAGWKKNAADTVQYGLGDIINKTPEGRINIFISQKGDHSENEDHNKKNQHPGKNRPDCVEEHNQYYGDADSSHLSPALENVVYKRKKNQGDERGKVYGAVFKNPEAAEPVKVGIANAAQKSIERT
jgi:hypothetical protein